MPAGLSLEAAGGHIRAQPRSCSPRTASGDAMLVIDASALVEVLTADPDEIHELAQRVLDAERMSPPNLIDYQVLNVLRRMVFGGDIDGELAEDTRRTLRALRLTRYPPTDEMSDRVWQLRHNASAYDASYLHSPSNPAFR